MTNNKEININDYIATVKEEAKPWIIEITDYFYKKNPSLKLQLIYNLPGYKLKNNYFVIKVNKQNLAIHTRNFNLIEKYSSKFEKANIGKGCIRLNYRNFNNLEILKTFIDETINEYQQ